MRGRLAPFTAVLVASTLVGCGPRDVRHSVSGVVTLDDQPVVGASVTFMPKGKGLPGIGETNSAGRFTMQDGGMHEGMPAGDYDVTIMLAEWSTAKTTRIPSGPPDSNGKQTETIEVMTVEPYVKKWIIPERYGRLRSSGLSASITGPTTTLAFPLTSNPKEGTSLPLEPKP